MKRAGGGLRSGRARDGRSEGMRGRVNANGVLPLLPVLLAANTCFLDCDGELLSTSSDFRISGTVTIDGEPAEGVTVRVLGLTRLGLGGLGSEWNAVRGQAQTDAEGEYAITWTLNQPGD